MKLINITAVFLIVFSSCEKEIVYEEYKTFQNHSWHTDSIIKFNFFIKDTIINNKINIKIRHNTDYEFQNLFLFVELDGIRDTVEIKLSNKEGAWLGKGIGDIREINTLYKNKLVFLKKKETSITLEQAMRYGDSAEIINLNNVLSAGISIRKNNE